MENARTKSVVVFVRWLFVVVESNGKKRWRGIPVDHDNPAHTDCLNLCEKKETQGMFSWYVALADAVSGVRELEAWAASQLTCRASWPWEGGHLRPYVSWLCRELFDLTLPKMRTLTRAASR